MEQRPFSLILVSRFILQMLQTGHDDDHGESGTYALGNQGGPGNAGNTHMEFDYKQQIQHDIRQS